jgi:hypothetical protein
VVLSIEDSLYERLRAYDEGNKNNVKFLIATAIRDYVSKREARTRRAEIQKHDR